MSRVDPKPGEVIGTEIDPAVAGGMSDEFVGTVLAQHQTYLNAIEAFRAEQNNVQRQIDLITSHTALLNTITTTVLPLIGKAVALIPVATTAAQGLSFVEKITKGVTDVTNVVNQLNSLRNLLPRG